MLGLLVLAASFDDAWAMSGGPRAIGMEEALTSWAECGHMDAAYAAIQVCDVVMDIMGVV